MIFLSAHCKNCKYYILISLHQEESNKILYKYILSSIYTSKIKFKFLSPKVEKHKIDKQKGVESVIIAVDVYSDYSRYLKFV